MSKKLKKRIEIICGLVGLDWEARQERAEQILNSTSWKQQLCNDFLGLSFRDLELHLQSVATERQKKEENTERKLAERSDNEKPMLRGGSRPAGSPAARPRTLAEILKQVYSPRQDDTTFEERQEFKFVAKDTGPDSFQDDPDADDPAGE